MVEVQSEITFRQMGIASIFKQYRLTVQPHQRDYSWTTKEVNTLFQDIAKAIRDNERGYFLGTIVTIPKSNEELQIIDGQQRLATVTILLAAFRDYLKTREPVLHEALNNHFLTGIDMHSRERTPQLKLNLDDNDYFKARVTEQVDIPEITRKSQDLLSEAFQEAKTRVINIVSGSEEKEHGDIINQWVDYLQSNAQVILLIVNNEANAYRMFETLNDRGLKTSQADLIKNYLYGRAEGRIQEVQQKWQLMRGALGTMAKKDITTIFLRHALTAIGGLIREYKVYEEIQQRARAPQPAVSLINTLESLAKTYVAIFNPEHDKWAPYSYSTRYAIEVLSFLDVKPARPLLLAITQKITNHNTLESFLTYCVSVCVRLMVANKTRTGSVEEGLAGAAHKIYIGDIIDIASLREELKNSVPQDEEFFRVFQTATVSHAKLARYYLRSLEMAAKDEREPWHIPNNDRNAINLEHILPDEPGDNWPQFTGEQVKMFRRRIGNLVLLRLSDNSFIKSAGFAVKKPILRESPYVLTRQAGEASEWNADDINNRQNILAEYALKAWPIK